VLDAVDEGAWMAMEGMEKVENDVEVLDAVENVVEVLYAVA